MQYANLAADQGSKESANTQANEEGTGWMARITKVCTMLVRGEPRARRRYGHGHGGNDDDRRGRCESCLTCLKAIGISCFESVRFFQRLRAPPGILAALLGGLRGGGSPRMYFSATVGQRAKPG